MQTVEKDQRTPEDSTSKSFHVRRTSGISMAVVHESVKRPRARLALNRRTRHRFQFCVCFVYSLFEDEIRVRSCCDFGFNSECRLLNAKISVCIAHSI